LDAWSSVLLGDVSFYDPDLGNFGVSPQDVAAAEAAFLRDEDAALAWLRRMVSQGTSEQLGRGVRVLARLASKSPRSFEQLLESTYSAEALVRTTATYWMARSEEREQERRSRIRLRLREMLSDRDANVRATATGALKAMEPQG
jgi:hypothetical protein